MWFEDFQGGHLGCRNRTILAILNLHAAQMPPLKLQLHLIYSLKGVVCRISRWPLWWPSWISEWNDFSNSESSCLPVPPTNLLLNLTYCLGAGVIWSWISKELILAVLNLHVPWCLQPSFSSNWLTPSVWQEMRFEEFQDCHYGSHLWYQKGMILGILNLHVTQMPPSFGSIWIRWAKNRHIFIKKKKKRKKVK